MTNGISPELTRAAIDVAVAREGLDTLKQQGKAAVELIESADAVAAKPPPPTRHALPGIGSLIDVYL